MIDVFKAASLGDLRRPIGGQSAGVLYAAPIGFETDSDAAIVISLRRTLAAGFKLEPCHERHSLVAA
jgi:hypothetical protein